MAKTKRPTRNVHMAFRTHTATARAFDRQAKADGLTRSSVLEQLVNGYINLRAKDRATPRT